MSVKNNDFNDLDIFFDKSRDNCINDYSKVFKTLGEKYENDISDNFYNDFSYTVRKGMGTTIGNALRRTLIGQVPGYAIRCFHVNNVNHEFSYISGMYESIQSLIMNLRKIVFKNLNDNVISGRAVLNIKGFDGSVFSNLVQSGEFEIVNKNVYLCTLTKDVDLKVDMYIEKGVGHILASNVSSNEYDSDAIICDSFFSPIEEVNFYTENIENKNYDEQLFISVRTNGSITPLEAMDQSISIWKKELAKISDKVMESDIQEETYIGTNYKPMKIHNTYLDFKIKNIPDMSSRIISCLDSLNIQYVGQLVVMTSEDLLKKPNFGQGSLDQLIRILRNIGLSLGMVLNNWECPKDHDKEDVLIR